MATNSSELESLRNGDLPQPQIVTGRRKSEQRVPFGDRRKAVLRQQLMVLLVNAGMLVGGMSLALPAVTLNQLTNPAEIFHLNKSQASWFASASSIACPVGSFSSVFLVDKFGRKNTVMFVNIIAIMAWSLMSTAIYDNSSLVFGQLIVSRLLSGIATGMGSSPTAVYGAEVSLPRLRARLTMSTSMAIASGVLFAYVVGYFFRNDWRFIGTIYMIYQIACLILLIPVKETPSWLLSKGRIEEAKASLLFFRGLNIGETHEEVEAEFALLRQSIQPIANEKKASFLKSIRLPKVYIPFLVSVIFFILQQFSGTFVVVVYAVQILTKAGVRTDPFLCAIYVGIARFVVATFVMTWELEKWGRRPVSIFSAASTAVCLFFLAGTNWFTWLQMPVLSTAIIVCFIIASAGQWSIPFSILPEIFPQTVRGVFCGILVGIGFLISFCAIKLFPWMMDWMGNGNVYAFYGVVSLFAILFVYLFIPETKGKTFQEIEEFFLAGNKTYRANEVC